MQQASSNGQSSFYADQQPAQSAARPRRLWRWLLPVVVIMALLLGYAAGHLGIRRPGTAQQVVTTQQTSTNQQAAADGQLVSSTQQVAGAVHMWTTLFSYHSSGNKQTQIFTAPKSWNLQWQCNPASYSIKQYNLVVTIYGSDGTLIAPAVINTICLAGNTTNIVQENQSGKIYLDVFSQGEWTLNIQQFK